MARRRGRGTARAARREAQPRRTMLFVASAATIAAVAALIWFGSRDAFSAPSTSPGPGVAQSGHVRGVATAPVTIDEYADFQCPACGQFARQTEPQLVQTYIAEGKVKVVFHHFAFLGMESNWAAEASECANDQGRFWDFHDRLYASQAGENKGAFSRDNLKKIGADLGLGTAFAACVDSGRYAQTVRDATQAGTDRGVRATPTLFIGERKIEGAATFDQLKPIIEAALSR